MSQESRVVRHARWLGWGAALAAAAVVLPGCGSEKKPISSKTSKYEVADAAAAPSSDSPDDAEPSRGEPARAAEPVPFKPAREADSSQARADSPFAGDRGKQAKPAEQVEIAAPLAPPPKTEVSPQSPAKPRTIASDDLDSYSLPKGGPAELIEFINARNEELRQMGAPGGLGGLSPQQMLAKVEQLYRAKLGAAGELLASDNLPADMRRTACRAKLEALGGLSDLQDPKADAERKAFAELLIKDKDGELAALGGLSLLGYRVQQLGAGRGGDPQAIVQEIKKHLERKTLGEFEFNSIQRAAVSLLRAGFPEEAMEAIRMVGGVFKDHPDKRLADSAADLLQQVKMLDFQVRLEDVMRRKPDSMAKLLEAAEALVQGGADVESIPLLVSAGMNLEASGDMSNAGVIYELLRKHFANHKDPNAAQQAKQVLEKYDRRAALIGAPLEIQGVLADGAPLDWSKYVGKVVLIDFWATWCGPCIRELPNLEANYKAFHERGFDIIGVNLDERRADVRQFLAQRSLPWATVFSNNPDAQGFEDPNALLCGVDAIPFLVLIGRDGKVAALHVRGEQLGKKLEELLGARPAGETVSP